MKQTKKDRELEKDASRYEAHADEQTGDYAVRISRGRDIVARILCALAAVALWLYVMSIDSPDHERTFTGVLVSIENEVQLATNYNMSVLSGDENTVSVTVRGKRSDIDKYASSDISAFVDLSGVYSSGLHALEVAAAAPAGLTVVDVSPNTISVYTDQVATKTVPVDVNLHYTMESTYGLGIPETNIEQVQVSGPAAVLESIAYARAELDLGQVTTSMTQRVQLKLVGESGELITNRYLRCDTTDVLVEIPVYMYKDVPVTVSFKHGYLHSGNANISVEPAKLTVRGDPRVLADFDAYEAIVLDETKITSDYSQRIKLSLPEGITNVDRIDSVTIDVSHVGTGTKSFSMAASRMTVEMPKGKEYEFLEPVFSFTVRGPASSLAGFRTADVRVSIDLTPYEDVVGIVTVPVTITPLSTTSADGIYAIGTYQIQVRLSDDE